MIPGATTMPRAIRAPAAMPSLRRARGQAITRSPRFKARSRAPIPANPTLDTSPASKKPVVPETPRAHPAFAIAAPTTAAPTATSPARPETSEDRYYDEVENLMQAALGKLSSDGRSLAVAASVIGPPTFFALKVRGLSFDDAVGVTLELVLPWLEQRRGELA
jgi:hypothetical protein